MNIPEKKIIKFLNNLEDRKNRTLKIWSLTLLYQILLYFNLYMRVTSLKKKLLFFLFKHYEVFSSKAKINRDK